MFNDFSKYKAIDFLKDDFFIDSIQNPTKESKLFWKKLILTEKIDSNEFIIAYQILKEMQQNTHDFDEHRLEAVWTRIQRTNKIQKRKLLSKSSYKYVAAASIFIFIGLLYLLINNLKDNQFSNSDYANDFRHHKQNPITEIQLISGESTMSVEGEDAKLEYDPDGNLKVNDQKINSTKSKKNEPEFQKLVVPFGKRAFITLSDGTELWVNTGTIVSFPAIFDQSTREISVDGEIYAKVSHDEDKPFIVRTNQLKIHVLGTKFNLSAYSNDNQANVVLVSGSVSLTPLNGKSTTITPNQMYTVTEHATSLRNVEVDKYISWIDGVYIFRNEPIEDILLKLSRYYNVTIKLPNNPSGISCSGKLELKEDLNELLNGLSEITSMSYGMKDDEYRVKFD